jgi:hypothetical protein
MLAKGEVSRIRQALHDHLLAEKAKLLLVDELPSAADARTFALHLELLRRLEAARQRGDPARLHKYLVALLLLRQRKNSRRASGENLDI